MGRKQDRLRREKRKSTWARKESEIRGLVKEERVQLTSHVQEKIATNVWPLEDVLLSLEAGFIEECRKDESNESVDGKKYIIIGPDSWGSSIETVGKILADDEGRLYLVITAY